MEPLIPSKDPAEKREVCGRRERKGEKESRKGSAGGGGECICRARWRMLSDWTGAEGGIPVAPCGVVGSWADRARTKATTPGENAATTPAEHEPTLPYSSQTRKRAP